MKNSVKEGVSVPNWVGGVAIGVLVIGLVVFGMKYVNGDGPRDPSTYPKSAYQSPYAGKDSSMSQGSGSAAATQRGSSAHVPGGGQ